jgi:hypothetical protein
VCGRRAEAAMRPFQNSPKPAEISRILDKRYKNIRMRITRPSRIDGDAGNELLSSQRS